MACITTTDMYLNLSTNICATITASRTSGSTNVHFSVTFSESQEGGQYCNLNAIKAKVDGYTDWITVKEYGNIWSGSNSTSFDVNVGNYDAGSRTFDVVFAVFNNAESDVVGDTASFQVSVGWGSSATAPAQPSVSVVERYTYGVKLHVAVSDWGVPGDASGRHLEGQIGVSPRWGSSPRRYRVAAAGVAEADIIVGDISGTYSGGYLNIKSNDYYAVGGYASNTMASSSRMIFKPITTLPAAPVGSAFQSTGPTTAQFKIADTSEGDALIIRLQYRYKKHSDSTYPSTWTNAGTGNHHTATVNLTSLTSGSPYDIQLRAQAGTSSDYSSITTYENAFTTEDVTLSITNWSSSYVSKATSTTTFSYIISAAGASSATYDIHVVCQGSHVSTIDLWFRNIPASGTFQFATENGTNYSMAARVYPAGESTELDTVSLMFSVPMYIPNAPSVSQIVWRDYGGHRLRWGVEANIEASTPGEGETYDRLHYREEFYDAANDSWIQGEEKTSTNSSVLFSTDSPVDPTLFPKLAIVAWQTNTFGRKSSDTRVVFQNQPIVSGVVIDGTKLAIVGVKTKTTDGVLHPGDYTHPFEIK